jgi:hypothetical protein
MVEYELRVIVEKVAVNSQEVVKRETIKTYAITTPASIMDLGLRHAEQIWKRNRKVAVHSCPSIPMNAGREQRRGGTGGRVWSSRGAQQGVARCTHAGPWLDSNLFVTLPVMTETTPQQWGGERGYIDKHLLMRYVTDVTTPLYYLSGPATMVAAMRQILTETHVPEDHIRTEEFSGY